MWYCELFYMKCKYPKGVDVHYSTARPLKPSDLVLHKARDQFPDHLLSPSVRSPSNNNGSICDQMRASKLAGNGIGLTNRSRFFFLGMRVLPVFSGDKIKICGSDSGLGKPFLKIHKWLFMAALCIWNYDVWNRTRFSPFITQRRRQLNILFVFCKFRLWSILRGLETERHPNLSNWKFAPKSLQFLIFVSSITEWYSVKTLC